MPPSRHLPPITALLSFRLNQLAQAGAGLPHPTRAIAVAAILINVFMATLESAIANTALPAIAADLGVSEASSIWVISAYHLAMVAALLPIASLGEIIGHRRISMAGLVLFTLASLACGLAPSLPWLIAGRLAQGVGAAGILGVALAMTRFVYPREQLGCGLGLNALVVSLSLAAGPTAASLILSLGSWHWLFLINVPLGLALGVCALPPTPRSARRYDAVAGLLCALFLALLVYTLNAYAHDVGAGGNTAYALATLAMLALLLRRQSGRGAPMLATDLLRRPIFALSAAATLGAFAAQTLAFVALPFMLQSLLGYTQVQTGFLITPWPARRHRHGRAGRGPAVAGGVAGRAGRLRPGLAHGAVRGRLRLLPGAQHARHAGRCAARTQRRRQRHDQLQHHAGPVAGRGAGGRPVHPARRGRSARRAMAGRGLRRHRGHRQPAAFAPCRSRRRRRAAGPDARLTLYLRSILTVTRHQDVHRP